MDPKKLCPGCMNEMADGAGSVCSHCGYQPDFVTEGQSHRLKPHTVLNEKYMIGKVLGEGGFGITYLGYDLTLEMKIAIKEYYPAGYATREIQNGNTVTAFTGKSAEFYQAGKDKFIKEARALAKFSNLPGIVSVRDYFEANNTSYIIMEYLEGNTLKHYLRSVGGKLMPQQALQMMEPVIRSLEEVHKQGLIHRDISPDNIMILNNGNMKLLDFGAAREVTGPRADQSLSVMLKPGYAPEEQYRTHGKQGPWTDLYAISATIYKCLTGTTPVEAMERMRNDTLMPPSRMGVVLPPWQEAALMKGMALYAEDRYHSLEDFYKAFYLNQSSGMNDTNDGRTVAMTGDGMANQASSAWGGKMNPQDNQFGGQPNGVQYDSATGMPLNQSNPFVMNGAPQQNMQQPDPFTMNGAPQQNMQQPDPFTMNGAPQQNMQQSDPFVMNGAPQQNMQQPDPFTMNGAPQQNMQQSDPFTMNGAPQQNMQQSDPFTQNGAQTGAYTMNGVSNDPFSMNGNNYTGPQYGYGQVPNQTQQKGNKAKLGIIIGVIILIIAAIIGIICSFIFGDKKDKDKEDVDAQVTEVPTEIPDNITEVPTEEPTQEPAEEPTETPVVVDGDFTGEYSTTVRGNGIGAVYDGYLLLKTEYGICLAIEESDGTYGEVLWLAALNEDVKVKSMAVYEDYLYLACGETGLVRTDLVTGDDMPIIATGNITSFAVAEDKIFYIVLADTYDSFGDLYMCDLDGSNSQMLEEHAVCLFLQNGSADFEYVDGSMYYVSSAEGSPCLKRMNADGTGAEVVADAEAYDYAFISGVYYHGGKIYSVTYNDIYAYDLATGAVELITETDISNYFPLVFAGDTLLYTDNDWTWHAIGGGQDVIYESGYNNGSLYMTTIDGELFYLSNYSDYYSVDYAGGVVNEENPINVDFYGTPDLDALPSGSSGYTQSANEDYRAAFTGYTDAAVSYMLLKNNQWEGNTLVYTDSEKYFSLTDEKVRYFTVIDSEVYYSTYDDATETFAFWKQELQEGSTPELLLDGTQVCAFSYYDGLIYYDNYDDYYELYCYDPVTGDNFRVDNDSLNYYYILDEYVYYECLDDGGMYKMSLDGSDKQFLFNLSDYNFDHLECLTAFNVDGSVYLAFNTDGGDMYITTEDGSGYEKIASGLEEFDINQDIYYADGSLYYSSNNGTQIHKLDIADYLQTDAASIHDEVMSNDSFIFFEVNNGLIYIELYDGNNEIRVIDAKTGEEYNLFDFS